MGLEYLRRRTDKTLAMSARLWTAEIDTRVWILLDPELHISSFDDIVSISGLGIDGVRAAMGRLASRMQIAPAVGVGIA